MPFTENTRNGWLSGVRDDATHIGLHSSDPTDTGSNEITGGGYSRKAVTSASFNVPSSGEMTLSGDLEFTATPAQTVTHFSVWNDSTLIGYGTLSGDNAFNAEGKLLLKAGTTMKIE